MEALLAYEQGLHRLFTERVPDMDSERKTGTTN
jgi:hypothetical protein